MKKLSVELPDPLAKAIDEAVEQGGFHDAAELAQAALREFVLHAKFSLLEKHQLDDIAAAEREAKAGR